MRASLPGWRPGICMEILSARPRASTIGCGFVDHATVQAERDRSATARAVALDSTSHRPASPGRGLPRRQRRRVTRRSGRGRSEAVAVPNRVRRRGSSTVLNRGAVGGPPVRIRVRQALRPIAIRHRAPHRELVVRFGGAVLPHGDRLHGPQPIPMDSPVRSRLSRRRLRTRPAPSPGAATPSRSCRRHGCRRPGPDARRCRPDRDPAGAAPPPSSCSRP